MSDSITMREAWRLDIEELKAERDEAREKAERYRLEANAMMAKLHELQTYADKLADGLPAGMLPRDVENLREANARLADDLQKAERERDEWIARFHADELLIENAMLGAIPNPAEAIPDSGPGYTGFASNKEAAK